MNIKQKRVMTYFIEATEEVLLLEGIENVSIKKVAEKAGYNSATIYNYFESIELLILYASVNYLKEYVLELKKRLSTDMDALEIYETTYRVFNHFSFREPEIFTNLFFGKYSDKLQLIIDQYYEIFPETLEGLHESTKKMLRQADIFKRDEAMIQELVVQGFVRKEKSKELQETISRVQHSYLNELLYRGGHIDLNTHEKEFLNIFHFVLSIAK